MKLADTLEKIENNLTTTCCDTHGHYGDEEAAKLARALKNNKTLTSLSLAFNNIGNKGAAALAFALRTNRTLTSLNLGNNSISDEGVTELAFALQTNKTLTSLNLCNNSISDEGAKELAFVLQTNKTLTSLNLCNNSISDKGAKYLACALSENNTLNSINLMSSGIGYEGAKNLACALSENNTLNSIDLSFNSIGDKGANDLVFALKANNTLLSLNLQNNDDISAAVRIKINQLLKDRQQKSRGQQILYSSVDPSRPVLDNLWVISLMRKPEGAHAEHAFLSLEGKKNNRTMIWFIDLVGNPILPGIGNGKIRIHNYAGDLEEELLFCCNRRMMDIRKGDRIISSSWNIPVDTANRLLESVAQAQANPPKFNILGQQSLFAIGTGASSSTATGHNCFTWAKEQLRNLNDPHIQLPMDDIQSWVFSATSRLLVDNRQQTTFWYHRPVVIATMIGAAATGGIAVGSSGILPDVCKLQ